MPCARLAPYATSRQTSIYTYQECPSPCSIPKASTLPAASASRQPSSPVASTPPDRTKRGSPPMQGAATCACSSQARAGLSALLVFASSRPVSLHRAPARRPRHGRPHWHSLGHRGRRKRPRRPTDAQGVGKVPARPMPRRQRPVLLQTMGWGPERQTRSDVPTITLRDTHCQWAGGVDRGCIGL
jgi:hypothetical protein